MKRLLETTLVFTICFILAGPAVAQVSVDNINTTRTVTEPSGARDDNNGGGDGSTLIGLNTGLVDNVLVYGLDLSSLAGMQTAGATVTVGVMQGFTNANHGQSTDMIVLRAIPGPNAGFVSGVGMISADDNQADDGSISFLNRIQFDTSGTTEPWLDQDGNGVANLNAAATTTVSMVPGYNQGAAPPTLEFTIDGPTAQAMIDDNIAGFAVSTIDDGDNRSRFFLAGGPGAITITFEPGMGGGGPVPPDTFTVFRGVSLSGAITDFTDSDDVRALYNPGFVLNDTEAPVWLIFDAVAPSATDFFVESQAGTPGLTYTVEAFDFTTSAFAVVGTQAELFNVDQVVTFPVTAANIDAGGEVQPRVGWRQTGFTINFPWEVRVDQVGWNQ